MRESVGEGMDLGDIITSCTRGVLPMHMPGHKRNLAKFPWLGEIGGKFDITEVDGFDNLNAPEGALLNLSERVARLWGAKRSFPLVNGSTVGILAAILGTVTESGTALIARGCHKSVYHGCELAGCGVEYLLPAMDDMGIWRPVSPDSVERALEGGGINLVVLTSPTYEGVISDIGTIADICHRHGAILLVDEAHGAHLGFGGFPESAVTLGADIVAHSLHKTLPGPTQTAVLHICGDFVGADVTARIARYIAMLQSSSPSYVLCVGIDRCVSAMERGGTRLADEWLDNLKLADRTARSLGALRIPYRDGRFHDPSKIIISTARANTTGTAVADTLRRKYRVEPEMATERYVLAMTGAGDTGETIGRLMDAVERIDGTLARVERGAAAAVRLPERVMKLGEAVRSRALSVRTTESEGMVCAEYVWRYPPGSPIIAPGEVISREVIDEITSAGAGAGSCYRDAPEHISCVR